MFFKAGTESYLVSLIAGLYDHDGRVGRDTAGALGLPDDLFIHVLPEMTLLIFYAFTCCIICRIRSGSGQFFRYLSLSEILQTPG